MNPTAQSIVFCASCQKIFNARNDYDLTSPRAYTLRQHHSHSSSFLKAVDLGCFVCSAIAKHANEEYRNIYSQGLQLSMDFRFYTLNDDEDDVIRLETQHSSSTVSQVHYMVFYLTPASGDTKARIYDQPTSYTSDSSVLSLGYQWYLTCRGCHKDCKELTTDSRWYPKRLIDVGSQGDELWRLFETSSESLRCPDYMTLSYRWGSSPSIKLTVSKMNEFKSGLPILDLPQTFQDAIVVLRRFSIRYLWIDALCIVQDSNTDWERESSSMRDIYTYSACNIAATASTDPNGGLFRARKLAEIQSGVVRAVGLDQKEKSFCIFEAHYVHRQIQDMPLHKRGWVLQEGLLAPRVLHFAQNQIFWECCTLERCEAFPGGLPVHHEVIEGFPPGATEDRLRNSFWRQLGQHGFVHSEQGKLSTQAFDLWNQIIRAYAHRGLTVSTDKLVALSGLAYAFHDRTGEDYVAGFWKSRLIEYLDWRVYAPQAKPLSKYRAPSWSWASVDGPVSPCGYGEDYRYMIEILEVQTIPLNVNPFGQILEGAFILVKGFILETCFNRRTDNLLQPCWLETNGKRVSAQVFEDTLDDRLQDGTLVYCLVLKRYPVYSGNSFHDLALMGLLLERVGLSPKHYRRIGHFTVAGKTDIESFEPQSVQEGDFHLNQHVGASSVVTIL